MTTTQLIDQCVSRHLVPAGILHRVQLIMHKNEHILAFIAELA